MINLKSLDIEEIFKMEKPLIDDIFMQYKSMLKSKEIYYDVVINEISKSRDLYDGEVPYSNYLEDKIQYGLLRLILSRNLSKQQGEKLYYSDENSVSLINIYLKDVFSQPILTKKYREELLVKSCNGDLESRKKLIECNLRIVVITAIRYIGNGMDFLDMVQEGNIALQNALDNFSLEKNTNFWNYLYLSINRRIRLKIMQLNNNAKHISQLDENTDDDFVDNSFEDLFVNSELNESLIEFIDKCHLTGMEYSVLRLVFGIDGAQTMTLNEIGKIYGITSQCASIYYRSALKKLKDRAARLQKDSDEVKRQDYICSHKKDLNILRIFIPYCTISDINKVLPRLTMFELQVIRFYSASVADNLVSSYKPVELYTILSKEIIPKAERILKEMEIINKSKTKQKNVK